MCIRDRPAPTASPEEWEAYRQEKKRLRDAGGQAGVMSRDQARTWSQ